MKKILIFISFLVVTSCLNAQSNSSSRYQSGYIKPSTGTYEQPHMKTTTNSTNIDNYSSKGNTNIYTGSTGSKAKDYTPAASNYGSGRTINTGS